MEDSYEIEEALPIEEPKLERNQSIAQSVKKLSGADIKKLSNEEKQVLIEMFAGMISNGGDSKGQNEHRSEPEELESTNSSRTTRPPMTSTPANQTPCKTPFQAPLSSIRKPCFTFEQLKKYKNIDLLAQCTLNCNDDSSYSTDLCRQHLLTQESRIPTGYGRSDTRRERSTFRMRSSSSFSSSCQNSESNVQVQERPNLQSDFKQTISRPPDQAYGQQTDFEKMIKSCLKCELDSRLGALSTKSVNITRPTFCVSFPEASENPSNQQIVAYNKGDKRLKFQEGPCFQNPTECDALANIPPSYNAPCLQRNPETAVRNYPFISPQRQTGNYPEVCPEQSYQPVVTYPSSNTSEHFRTAPHPPCNVCEQFSTCPPCKEQYSKVPAYTPRSVEQFPRTTRSTLNMESFPKAFCLPCHDQYPKPPVYQDCNSLQYSRNVYPSCLDQRPEAISPPCRMQYPKSPYIPPTMDPPFDTWQYAQPARYSLYSSQPFHQSYPSHPFHQSYQSHQFHQPHPFSQSYPSHQSPPSYLQLSYPPHPSYPSYPSYNPSDPFLRPVASLQRNQMPQYYEEMPIAPQASVYNFPPQSRIRKPSLEKVNKSSQTCSCICEEPSEPFAIDPQVKRESQTNKFQEIARDIQSLKLSKRDYSPLNLCDDYLSNFRRSNNNLDKSCESKHVFFKTEKGYNFKPTSAVPNQVIVPGLSCGSDYSQNNQPKPPNAFGCLPNAQKKDEPQDVVLNMNFIPCCGTRTCWSCSKTPRYYSIKIP